MSYAEVPHPEGAPIIEVGGDEPTPVGQPIPLRLSPASQSMLGGLLSMYAETIHDWATDKGFWPELPPEVEVQRKLSKLALMVEEIGELVSAVRAKEMPEAEHIAGFTQEEEEAADLLTRLLDYCGHYKVRVGQAMVTKMAYNHTRPHLHGKQA